MNASAAIPDLALTLGSGKTAQLSDYRGAYLVVYFYPKDSTPGCTTEGLDFSALHAQFAKANCAILGVSRDSVKSHANFCAKQNFAFDLVSDSNEKLCRAFDVIHEKNMYGRKVFGIVRSTFLLGPDGRIVQNWRGVKVAGHADAVLAAVHQAQQPA